MPKAIGSAATSSTWRSISPPAGADSPRWRGDAALDRARARRSRSTIEPLTEMRDVDLTWYVGLDAEAHEDRRYAVERRGDRRGDVARVVGLFRLTFRDPAWCWTRSGRAGLSDPGDDARQDHAHEAAEPGDRLADAASGGSEYERGSPLATIPVGVVVERSKSASRGSTFTGGRSAVLGRRAGTPPWTKLSDDGERATFYAGAAKDRAASDRDRQLSRQSASGDAVLWVILRPAEAEPPYELRRLRPTRPKAKA